MSLVSASKNSFLKITPENENYNQYWYSEATIAEMVNEIVAQGCQSVACVACPSLFFSFKLEHKDIFDHSILMDIDTQWEKEPNYYCYDYKKPLDLPEKYKNSFDCVVIDPPFITRDAWEKFAEHGKWLIKEDGLFLCSSIAENEPMLHELLNLKSVGFKPSIPHLIYQVCIYYSIFIIICFLIIYYSLV